MHSSRLLELLKKLKKKEMTRFVAFAYSPYHNKHKEVQALCDYLNSFYPNFNKHNCNRQEIFKKLYPKQSHDQKKLNILFSYTVRLFEAFLSHEQLQGKPILQPLLLLEKLRQQEQFSYLEKKMEQTDKLLEQAPIRNSSYYNRRFLLATEADEYYTQQSRHQKDQSIQHKQNSLDTFYISEKLKDACEMILRNRLLKVDYSIQLLEEVAEFVKTKKDFYANIPPVAIYYQIYQMIIEDDQQYYFELIPLLEKFIHYFPEQEKRSIYNYAQNFCIARINEGEAAFMAELFKLYQKQLEDHLLIEKGYLLEWHYKNIVTVGLRLKEFDWVKNFIENYKDKLQPEAVKNAYRFNLAAYYYETEQYEKVLDLLVRVEFTDIRYNLDAKSLLLRTYYNLNEYEALQSLTNAFRNYLRRNKLISDYRKQGYYNLFKFTERALRIKMALQFESLQKNLGEIEKLKSDMKKASTIFNKKWLDERVDLLHSLTKKLE